MKNLFWTANPSEFARLNWRIFMSYLGSPDCGELSLQDRVLVIELYKELEKYFHKKCREADEESARRKELERINSKS